VRSGHNKLWASLQLYAHGNTPSVNRAKDWSARLLNGTGPYGGAREQLTWILVLVVAAALLILLIRALTKKSFESKRKAFGFDLTGGSLSIGEVIEQIEAETAWARSERSRLSCLLLALKNPRFEDMSPDEVVGLADTNEVDTLLQITGAATSDPKTLVRTLRSIGSNGLAQFWRALSKSDDEIDVSYDELLMDACKNLGIRKPRAEGIYGLEVVLQQRAFNRIVQSMPEASRHLFLKEFFEKAREPSLGKEAWVGGGIVAANLSGFGLYLASSTALGAITSAIGVALPFAVYTGMSSTLAVLIGPAGWVVLGTWVLHKLGRPDPNKVVAGTLLIANIRQRLISVRDEPVPYIKHDLDVILEDFNASLSALRTKITMATKYRIAGTDRVNRDAYLMPDRPALYVGPETQGLSPAPASTNPKAGGSTFSLFPNQQESTT
jgi:uncharacterized protein YaaW (UPF0174 family)